MLFRIIIVLFSLTLSSNSLASSHDDKSLISVTGKAEIDVVPDEVHISMTIQKDHKNAEEAQSLNDEVADKILRMLKTRIGIDEKDIQTNFINIRPVYEYPQCGNRRCTTSVFTHFETKKGIAIKLKDTEKLQELLQKSIEAGVTHINNVSFASSKFDELQDKAQLLATKDAKRRAEDIADSIGISIGKPHRINVSQSYNHAPRAEMMAMRSMSASKDSGGQTIALGQITITSNVSADFEIE